MTSWTGLPSRTKAAARVVALALLAGCVASEDAATDSADQAPAATAAADGMPTVTITSPADGTIVAAGSLTVTLEVSGVAIVMAGDTTPNTGHHHLFLDRDVTAPDVPVPAEPGFIVHMGDGSTSYTFENVTPGVHRLIAVVADGLHYPLQPWVVDTVGFIAR